MSWNKIKPYSYKFTKNYEEFKESTIKFINDKFSKKEIKRNNVNKLLNVDTTVNETIHYIKDIDFILDKEGYNEIIKTMGSICDYDPIITFHSTQNIDKLNSIAKLY